MEHLQWRVENNIAHIVFERPPANALAASVLSELSDVLDEIEADKEVHAAVLYGEGRFFAAGADIKEFTNVENSSGFSDLGTNGQKVFNKMEALTKPVIAAIHGAALGGGLEMAMACHLRVSTKEAKLGLPETTLGLIPGYAGSQRLPELVGRPKAGEMILTGLPITGEEAERWGLVNKAVPEGEHVKAAVEIAGHIASKSRITTKMGLELLRYAIPPAREEGSRKEAELFGRAFASEDAKEGIQAFIEKRKPSFRNK